MKNIGEENKYLEDSLNKIKSELEGVDSLYNETATKYNDLFEKFSNQQAENSNLVTERDDLAKKINTIKELIKN